jgi:hypothetical protein
MERTAVSQRRRQWHAVSIVSGPASCRAAQELRAIRFLSGEAPPLPLPGCRAGKECSCVYKHHEDRRAKSRRAEEVTGYRRPNPTSEERRKLRDRRSTDD